MSESMDFTDMFRRSESEGTKPGADKARSHLAYKSAGEEGSATQENHPPAQQQNYAESDSMVYVKNTLKNMNHPIQAKDLSQAALQAIEMLYSERCYWQNQTTALSEEVMKLKNTNSQLQRDKIRDADLIESYKKENQQLLSRISAINMEHRDVKNHWLAEKNDLQTRIFQVQALNTQATGSLKKKEKDFVLLQNQLAKIVKDSSKGQTKPSIVMSLPVRKNLSQDSAPVSGAALLKDAEMQAAKKTITALDSENQTLRSSMESLQQSMDELTESLESAVRLSEDKTHKHLETIVSEHAAAMLQKDELLATLQQQLATITQERDLQQLKSAAVDNCPVLPPAPPVAAATSPSLASRVEMAPATPLAPALVTSTRVEFLSPSQLRSSVKFRAIATPGSIAKRYLEGTPGARPVQWVVEQANTEVKRLRERAEQIARGEVGAAAVTALEGQHLAWAKEESSHSTAGSSSVMWRMKLQTVKMHLSEALLVIQEQDRLIHSALIGRPHGMHDAAVAKSEMLAHDLLEVDEECIKEMAREAQQVSALDAADKAEVLNNLANFSSLKDSDFLPPASPATWALLQSYGWSCLPDKTSGDAAGAPYSAAAEEATSLAGEFDAEK